MALIDCPDCARPVSEAAISCPNCGRPFVHDDLFSLEIVAVFLRSIVDATLRPRRFLERSSAEPWRYARPKRVLTAYAVMSGLTTSAALWIRPNGLPSLTQKIIAGGASLAVPWIAVIAFRLAGGAARTAVDWREGTRLGGFKAAVSLGFLPLTFPFAITSINRGGYALASSVPTVVLAIVYGTIAFRSLGATPRRAIAGGAAVTLAQLVLTGLLIGSLTIALVLAGRWVPELRAD